MGSGLLEDLAQDRGVVLEERINEAEVCEVVVLGMHPFIFDVVDNELDIRRDPVRLDR